MTPECRPLLQVSAFRRFLFRGVDLEEDEVDDSIEDEIRTASFGVAASSATSSSEESSVEAITAGRFLLGGKD